MLRALLCTLALFACAGTQAETPGADASTAVVTAPATPASAPLAKASAPATAGSAPVVPASRPAADELPADSPYAIGLTLTRALLVLMASRAAPMWALMVFMGLATSLVVWAFALVRHGATIGVSSDWGGFGGGLGGWQVSAPLALLAFALIFALLGAGLALSLLSAS
ncbi:hypothetical protein [Niveibacterium sp. SC-1]|uniref:hypothetical protein n=1 Tax=Niveibacterium sp. SC-1 TaxID=3135646 RepID=UPI00311E5C70